MSEGLKPCLFCGSRKPKARFGRNWGWYVGCECGAVGPKAETRGEAVSVWNAGAKRECREMRSGEGSFCAESRPVYICECGAFTRDPGTCRRVPSQLLTRCSECGAVMGLAYKFCSQCGREVER